MIKIKLSCRKPSWIWRLFHDCMVYIVHFVLNWAPFGDAWSIFCMYSMRSPCMTKIIELLPRDWNTLAIMSWTSKHIVHGKRSIKEYYIFNLILMLVIVFVFIRHIYSQLQSNHCNYMVKIQSDRINLNTSYTKIKR